MFSERNSGMDHPIILPALLLQGFVLCFSFFNFVSLLISAFYHKKFGHPSPRAGFAVAIALGVGYLVVSTLSIVVQHGLPFIESGLLLGCGLASMWSSAALFYTMKRIRK